MKEKNARAEQDMVLHLEGNFRLKAKIRIFGSVLASGQSIRMGKPKLLLHWQGVSLIEHILNKTTVIPFEQVQVVIPDQNEHLKRIVTNIIIITILHIWDWGIAYHWLSDLSLYLLKQLSFYWGTNLCYLLKI